MSPSLLSEEFPSEVCRELFLDSPAGQSIENFKPPDINWDALAVPVSRKKLIRNDLQRALGIMALSNIESNGRCSVDEFTGLLNPVFGVEKTKRLMHELGLSRREWFTVRGSSILFSAHTNSREILRKTSQSN